LVLFGHNVLILSLTAAGKAFGETYMGLVAGEVICAEEAVV